MESASAKSFFDSKKRVNGVASKIVIQLAIPILTDSHDLKLSSKGENRFLLLNNEKILEILINKSIKYE